MKNKKEKAFQKINLDKNQEEKSYFKSIFFQDQEGIGGFFMRSYLLYVPLMFLVGMFLGVFRRDLFELAFYLLAGALIIYIAVNILFYRFWRGDSWMASSSKKFIQGNVQSGEGIDKKLEDFKLNMMNALKNLEEERNKTLAIVSNFIYPIVVLDKENRILLFNQAARKKLGFVPGDYGKKLSSQGTTLNSFKGLIRRDFTSKILEKEKATGRLVEELAINKTGQTIFYKVITTKVVSTANPTESLGTMKVFYDVTREKMIDQMKSEFISIAAHQLRSPLSAIKWSLEVLLGGDMGKLNKEQKETITAAYQSNERMIELVNDLLNVSRIEQGRFGYSFKKEDLTKIIKKVAEESSQLAKSRNVKIEVKIGQENLLAEIDAEKIELALQNLVENAIKYTLSGGEVEITAREDKKRKEIVLEIKDTGVGIPEEEEGKLFTKFFRASNVKKMDTAGTGLGLFIVKNIIDQHKGKIEVRSKLGKGTTVFIFLPRKTKRS